jgi:NADPH:quinone reductase
MLKEEFKQEYVLNSTSATFDEDLKAIIEITQPTVLLEAISGDIGGRIMRLMPRKSKMILYGALSKSNASNIDPLSFMFLEQTIEGFLLD